MNQAGFTPILAQPRRWDFLAGLMGNLGLKTFAEVGCKEGRTTGHILKTVPDAKVLAIDPWTVQKANGDPTRETYKDWDFSKIEKEFWENVGEHKARVQMWIGTSEQVATGELGDTSATYAPALDCDMRDIGAGKKQFDLVFIDALHDHESVKRDIELWWPKVRTGGVLAGHDYNHKWPGVERAVSESFSLMEVGVATDSVWFVVKHE